jgi:hypothetical protein
VEEDKSSARAASPRSVPLVSSKGLNGASFTAEDSTRHRGRADPTSLQVTTLFPLVLPAHVLAARSLRRVRLNPILQARRLSVPLPSTISRRRGAAHQPAAAQVDSHRPRRRRLRQMASSTKAGLGMERAFRWEIYARPAGLAAFWEVDRKPLSRAVILRVEAGGRQLTAGNALYRMVVELAELEQPTACSQDQLAFQLKLAADPFFVQFTASILLPGFLKSLLATYLSTAERSVRLSSVLGNEHSHLGGQYTVHILAVSCVVPSHVDSLAHSPSLSELERRTSTPPQHAIASPPTLNPSQSSSPSSSTTHSPQNSPTPSPRSPLLQPPNSSPFPPLPSSALPPLHLLPTSTKTTTWPTGLSSPRPRLLLAIACQQLATQRTPSTSPRAKLSTTSRLRLSAPFASSQC